jgi:hypothetical protein
VTFVWFNADADAMCVGPHCGNPTCTPGRGAGVKSAGAPRDCAGGKYLIETPNRHRKYTTMTNQEEVSHEEIAAKLSRVLGEQIPASFVARTEEVCGKPFADLTRQDLSRLTMLTQLDLIEAENDQAQIEGELKRLNDDADFCLVCSHAPVRTFGLCDSCLGVARTLMDPRWDR